MLDFDYYCAFKYQCNFHMASQGAAVSLVELGEYQKASEFLEKLVKVSCMLFLVPIVFVI